MKHCVADFETVNDINDCRVWAWAICDVADYNINVGTNLHDFLMY